MSKLLNLKTNISMYSMFYLLVLFHTSNQVHVSFNLNIEIVCPSTASFVHVFLTNHICKARLHTFVLFKYCINIVDLMSLHHIPNLQTLSKASSPQ